MAGTIPGGVPEDLDIAVSKSVEAKTLPLHAERVVVSKRVRRTLVKATRSTLTRDEVVLADLSREHVIVERLPIGRVVETVPPIRQEGDMTIMPVVEEELFVIKRLILKEEVHLRRVRSKTTHSETVTVREQHVAVTRTALDD